jgi:hypothetical protein
VEQCNWKAVYLYVVLGFTFIYRFKGFVNNSTKATFIQCLQQSSMDNYACEGEGVNKNL